MCGLRRLWTEKIYVVYITRVTRDIIPGMAEIVYPDAIGKEYTGTVVIRSKGPFKGAVYFMPDDNVLWKSPDPGGATNHGLVITGDKSGLSDGLRVRIKVEWGGSAKSILVARIVY